MPCRMPLLSLYDNVPGSYPSIVTIWFQYSKLNEPPSKTALPITYCPSFDHVHRTVCCETSFFSQCLRPAQISEGGASASSAGKGCFQGSAWKMQTTQPRTCAILRVWRVCAQHVHSKPMCATNLPCFRIAIATCKFDNTN